MAVTEDLNKRIADLLRRRPEAGPPPERGRPRPPRVSGVPVSPPAAQPVEAIAVPPVPDGATLRDVLPAEGPANELGGFWLCRRRVVELLPAAPDLAARTKGLLTETQRADLLDPALVPLLGMAPAELLFLDLETAGLSAAPLFLIGVLRLSGEGMLVEQYLARDYAEEAPMLWGFADATQGVGALVTFNGKSFDVPYIRDRMTYYHLPWAEEFAHVDLLHVSRRRWKGVLPNCKLQTLERHVCGRARLDDLPAGLIPERYHDFVETQEAATMAPILHHNWLDLVTMVEVLNELLDPPGEGRPADRGGDETA